MIERIILADNGIQVPSIGFKDIIRVIQVSQMFDAYCETIIEDSILPHIPELGNRS